MKRWNNGKLPPTAFIFLLPGLGRSFCTEVGYAGPGQAAWVEVTIKNFRQIRLSLKKKKVILREYSTLGKLLIEKRVRRAAPVAQRRPAGEPEVKPDASLPRSEISQFLLASRFIISSPVPRVLGTYIEYGYKRGLPRTGPIWYRDK